MSRLQPPRNRSSAHARARASSRRMTREDEGHYVWLRRCRGRTAPAFAMAGLERRRQSTGRRRTHGSVPFRSRSGFERGNHDFSGAENFPRLAFLLERCVGSSRPRPNARRPSRARGRRSCCGRGSTRHPRRPQARRACYRSIERRRPGWLDAARWKRFRRCGYVRRSDKEKRVNPSYLVKHSPNPTGPRALGHRRRGLAYYLGTMAKEDRFRVRRPRRPVWTLLRPRPKIPPAQRLSGSPGANGGRQLKGVGAAAASVSGQLTARASACAKSVSGDAAQQRWTPVDQNRGT